MGYNDQVRTLTISHQTWCNYQKYNILLIGSNMLTSKEMSVKNAKKAISQKNM